MMIFAVLVVFTLLPLQIEALTGRTCTQSKSRSESYTAYQSAKRAQRYTKKCGWLKRSRCTRYRDYYVKETVTRTRTVYDTEIICCTGWRVDSSGSNCDIHDKFPVVLSCPGTKTVIATGKTTIVTWDKPEFKEPFGYQLKITSTYGGESETLGWGDTRVTYVATSLNNNKQIQCSFVVSVFPPKPKAVVKGYSNGETVNVDEHQQLSLECRAEYGKPPPALTWYRNDVKLTSGVSEQVIPSDYLDYKHAVNTLTFNPTRTDDGATYECRTSPDVSKYSIKTKVAYEVVPVVTFCPSNVSRESSTRQTLVTWSAPTFKDPRNDETVDVVGNMGSETQKRLGWGEHRVVYTGTNRRNKLFVTCTFYVTLKPMSCDKSQLTGKNGGVICGFWQETNSHVCEPFCSSGYDVMWLGRHPQLYICDVTGRWRPTPLPINCTQPMHNIESYYLASRGQYSSGTCAAATTEMKTKFASSLDSSPYKYVCKGGNCGHSIKLTVECF